MKKQTQFQIFKTWALTVLLTASMTFAATVIFAAPILIDESEIKLFWEQVFGISKEKKENG